METSYSSLAELRSALTAENPDERASAYGSVMEHDVQVSSILGTNPDGAAVQTLVDAGVIPSASENAGDPAAQTRKQQVELLQQCLDQLETIAANTGGA